MAVGAIGIGTVTGEEYTHVHFVGLGFDPIKKSFDSVPVTIFPCIL